MRRRTVEVHGVALGELVDRPVEVDLERAAGGVDRDLAVLDVVPVRPAAGARRPLAQHRRAGRAAELAQAVLVGLAVGLADDLDRLTDPRRRPETGDRHVQRGGDALDRTDARAGQAALDLAQERMRQAGLLAEPFEGEPAFTPEGPNPRSQIRLETVGGEMTAKHRVSD